MSIGLAACGERLRELHYYYYRKELKLINE